MKTVVSAIFACILASVSGARGDEAFSSLDTDHNGTIEEQEAQAAGRALFTRLDRNQNGSLDAAEIGDRLGAAVQKGADPGADGALNAEEYAALVKARFKSANTDADGTVDENELKTLTGALLLLVIK